MHGISSDGCMKLAFEMAIVNNIPHPNTWKEAKKAGRDWYYGFRKRHPTVSLRKAESCSLARATAFNKHNVDSFFDKLKSVYQRYPNLADGTRVFNLDETATTTVHIPPKTLAARGSKQVCQRTSGERGVLVTTCCIVNASGNSLPPALVFPRVNFKDFMLHGAPTGSLGLATPSGWMNADLFVEVMKHFIKNSQSSKENPSLLIMDNHESHLSLQVVDMAKEHGVTIITLPPHCSNRMQPLDVAVYKSFKTYYNKAVDNWMDLHPGKPVSIYEIAGFVGIAHKRALTPTNIISGFKTTGIYPLDDQVFSDDCFLSSAVTDRPLENRPPKELEKQRATLKDKECFQTPEQFKGYPKAQPRKTNSSGTGRQPGRSMIATDTPEKTILAQKRSRQTKGKDDAMKAKRRLLETTCSTPEGKIGEEEFPCLVCAELYQDPPSEDWIQCTTCKRWAHEACCDTSGEHFICDICRV